jgi:uncharacterized glyoxalase superfamily protein PhnB
MNPPPVSLGYVILYVADVAASLVFYEQAFGLSRRLLLEEAGKGYGELETGATRLAFVTIGVAKEHLNQDVIGASLQQSPLGVEIALVTADVAGLFRRALQAGATAMAEPATKPWGQTVAYVRDNAGHLVELCTPLP